MSRRNPHPKPPNSGHKEESVGISPSRREKGFLILSATLLAAWTLLLVTMALAT